MYEFLDRLINIALPRVRDFRGLTDRSFDGNGNYAFGIKEHIIFPEIDYDKIDRVWGMDVIICTSAKTDAEARALIDAFNFPFRKPARKAAETIELAEVAHMAKTSSVEKNNRRRKLVKQYAGKRARLKAIIAEQERYHGGALRGPAEAGRAAAQFGAKHADPQPLRGDGPSACLLPQTQDVASGASRAGQPGSDPRHGQVELVTDTDFRREE